MANIKEGPALSPYQYPTPGRHKDGQPKWTILDLKPLRDLVRLAQRQPQILRHFPGLDREAINELQKRFNGWLKSGVGKALVGFDVRHAPEFDDLLQESRLALLEVIRDYDPNRGTGLTAYASRPVAGAIYDEIRRWRRRGDTSETRAERATRHTNYHDSYNTIEGLQPDNADGNPVGGSWRASDDRETPWCDDSGGKVTDEHWQRIATTRALPTGWIGIRGGRWASFEPEPLKPISRERYEQDQAQAFRAAHSTRLNKDLALLATRYGAPPECFGVDENPRRNGGRWPTKKLKQIHIWRGPILKPLPLREHLKRCPTPGRYKIDAPVRGNASALGVFGHLVEPRVQSRVKRTNQPLKEVLRVAEIGLRRYAPELSPSKTRSSPGALPSFPCWELLREWQYRFARRPPTASRSTPRRRPPSRHTSRP